MCSRGGLFLFPAGSRKVTTGRRIWSKPGVAKNLSCVSPQIWGNEFRASIERALLLKGNCKYLEESKQNLLKKYWLNSQI